MEPLEIKCTSSDCRNELHCFKATRALAVAGLSGCCRACGADLIDWKRLHQKDIDDVKYTFKSLRRELIRHYFWHVEIDTKAINHARRKGRQGLRVAVKSRLLSSVGAANPPRDGYQTPREGSGNSIHYAQHATASCCRTCMEYWHNVPKGESLTPKQLKYFTDLCMLFLNERLPMLTEQGEYVPPMRKKSR